MPVVRCRSRAAFGVRSQYNNGDSYMDAADEVSSLQNATVKHCVKVRTQRSYRESSGTVIVSGADLVHEVAPHAEVRTLFYLRTDAAPDLPAERYVAVTQAVMIKLAGLESVGPGTLAAEVSTPEFADFQGWAPGRLARLLVLERCQDPGNLGTLLRTALALGWDGAYLLPGCADPFNDKSLRASRGAVFKLPLAAGPLQEWRGVAEAHSLASLAAEPHSARPGFGSSGRSASQQGGAVQQVASDARVGLVLGSEGQGLSEEVLRHCVPVAIPMPGEMESLNVAAAGAILMFALSAGAPQLMGELGAASAQPAAAGAASNGAARR